MLTQWTELDSHTFGFTILWGHHWYRLQQLPLAWRRGCWLWHWSLLGYSWRCKYRSLRPLVRPGSVWRNHESMVWLHHVAINTHSSWRVGRPQLHCCGVSDFPFQEDSFFCFWKSPFLFRSLYQCWRFPFSFWCYDFHCTSKWTIQHAHLQLWIITAVKCKLP